MTAINASFLHAYVNPTELDDARLAPYFSSSRPSVASNFTGPGTGSSIISTKGNVGCTLLDLLFLFAVARLDLPLRAAFFRLRAAAASRSADALRILTRFFDRALARFFRLAIVTLPLLCWVLMHLLHQFKQFKPSANFVVSTNRAHVIGARDTTSHSVFATQICRRDPPRLIVDERLRRNVRDSPESRHR